MKKFDGILICSDVDGTLLRNDKSLSPENTEAIEYFKANGGLFTIMTGRLFYALSSFLSLVKPNAPLGFGNGLGLYDVATHQMPVANTLDSSALEVARYVYKKYPHIGIELTTYKEILCAQLNDTVKRHLNNELLPLKMTNIDTFSEQLAKILFAAPGNELEVLMEDLPNLEAAAPFQLIRSDEIFYEVLPKGKTKGTLLVSLTELLGIDIKNTIAIGDNENDISMIQAAGRGIAVANATENTKAAADIITVSNENNAIAKIIYEL